MFLSQVKVAMGFLVMAVTIVGGAGVLVSQASGPADQEKKSEGRSPEAQRKVAPSSRELPIDTVVTVAAADEIASAYQTNAALADEKFTGKRIIVTGRVLRIRGARLFSATGAPSAPQNSNRTPGARIYYLEMSGAEKSRAGTGGQTGSPVGYSPFLRFQFAQDSRNQLAKLRAGDEVRVEGELQEPSENSSGAVTLLDFHKCRIVNSKEN